MLNKFHPHSIETPIGCKKQGWKWYNKWGLCVQFEDKTSGCLAPVKGLELCWEGIDLYNDVDTVESWKGKYMTDVVGIGKDGEFIVNSGEWGEDFIFDSMEEAVDEGKYIAFDMAKSILKGRAADYCLRYEGLNGKISEKPTPHCIVTNTETDCVIKKPFRFRRRHV